MNRWRIVAGVVGIGGLLVGAVMAGSGPPTGPARTGTGPTQRDAPSEREAPPDDWMVSQRAAFSGVPRGAPARAAVQADAVDALTAARDPALSSAPWHSIGPTNIGGRILDIAADPSVANTLYAAAATGGVWKSVDGGATFASSWPGGNPQPIGAIAIGPDGTLFAGSGEAGPGGGSITYGGRGVYRSTDGGATWRSVGLRRLPVPRRREHVAARAGGSHIDHRGGRHRHRPLEPTAPVRRDVGPYPPSGPAGLWGGRVRGVPVGGRRGHVGPPRQRPARSIKEDRPDRAGPRPVQPQPPLRHRDQDR